MLDLARAVPSGSLFGRMLRAPLRLIPEGTVVPVLTGPLRGSRWVVGAGLHGCWLGTFEADKQRRMAAYLRPGQVFYDVGANVGIYTLLAAKRVGPRGKVYAFEPAPENIAPLQRHLHLNHCQNVRLIECAIADYSGEANFQADGSSIGRLSAVGRLKVRVESLDGLIARERIAAADVVKIDVEGAEALVLRGGTSFFATHRPAIFLATHGPDARRDCRAQLEAWGYRLTVLDDGDPDGGDEILAVKS